MTAFEAPTPLPFDLSVDTVTLGEAAAAPATRAILEAVVPGLAGMAEIDYVSRMSLRQTANWGLVGEAELDRIDADLAELPRTQWPVAPVE
ncbi:MAG TPA: hypothetical protein VKG43_12115 [Acidimicrobiales bacterium]|nr:hypothetical protein [Acidimicrobiales bacterium]